MVWPMVSVFDDGLFGDRFFGDRFLAAGRGRAFPWLAGGRFGFAFLSGDGLLFGRHLLDRFGGFFSFAGGNGFFAGGLFLGRHFA